jgi:hypothetical protein
MRHAGSFGFAEQDWGDFSAGQKPPNLAGGREYTPSNVL